MRLRLMRELRPGRVLRLLPGWSRCHARRHKRDECCCRTIQSRSGTAATHTVGTGSGHLAVLDPNGRFALARLGSGSPASDRFLRGDGAWQVVPFNASGVDTRIATWARASSPSGQVPIASGGTGGGTAAAARNNLGLGSAALATVGTIANTLPVLGGGGRFAPVRLGSGTPSARQISCEATARGLTCEPCQPGAPTTRTSRGRTAPIAGAPRSRLPRSSASRRSRRPTTNRCCT